MTPFEQMKSLLVSGTDEELAYAARRIIQLLDPVLTGARKRLVVGHNDTCGVSLGCYSCSCGHDELGEAVEALDGIPHDPQLDTRQVVKVKR